MTIKTHEHILTEKNWAGREIPSDEALHLQLPGVDEGVIWFYHLFCDDPECDAAEVIPNYRNAPDHPDRHLFITPLGPRYGHREHVTAVSQKRIVDWGLLSQPDS